MRGSRGIFHAPSIFTYVGRLVVEKNPSGNTPSAGAGRKRAFGAWANRGELTSGWEKPGTGHGVERDLPEVRTAERRIPQKNL